MSLWSAVFPCLFKHLSTMAAKDASVVHAALRLTSRYGGGGYAVTLIPQPGDVSEYHVVSPKSWHCQLRRSSDMVMLPLLHWHVASGYSGSLFCVAMQYMWGLRAAMALPPASGVIEATRTMASSFNFIFRTPKCINTPSTTIKPNTNHY